MYRKQVRRRRAVLVLLVVACLMLISISISQAESGPLKSIQNGVSSILSPIQDGADRALKPFRDMANWFDETFDARGESEDLKSEVAELRQENLDLQRAAVEAGYAKELEKLAASSGLDSYERVSGSVIGRSPTAWYSTIRIDIGESDGVETDDAVITADGLIGRVSETYGSSADVDLVTGSSAVTARVVPNGPTGSIVPIIGAPGKLDFTLIQGDKEVEDGDKLITTGFFDDELESRYPADIPIGQVSEAIPGEQDRQQSVTVEPFADLAELDGVTVLAGGES